MAGCRRARPGTARRIGWLQCTDIPGAADRPAGRDRAGVHPRRPRLARPPRHCCLLQGRHRWQDGQRRRRCCCRPRPRPHRWMCHPVRTRWLLGPHPPATRPPPPAAHSQAESSTGPDSRPRAATRSMPGVPNRELDHRIDASRRSDEVTAVTSPKWWNRSEQNKVLHSSSNSTPASQPCGMCGER